MTSHNGSRGSLTTANSILLDVRRVINEEGLSLNEAAKLIGITPGSLKRHLSGEYVRSDSIARYRAWLDHRTRAVEKSSQPSFAESKATKQIKTEPDDLLAQVALRYKRPTRPRPYLVVDLFSGCGGMSLGFDILEQGQVFKTVMALDIDEPMVRAYNNNSVHSKSGTGPVCRRADLSQFLNETEVLAFYLDHLESIGLGADLSIQLQNLPEMGLSEFKRRISALDQTFLARLRQIRTTPSFRKEYSELVVNALGQTSVAGFHDALCLPLTSGGAPNLGTLIWSQAKTDNEPCARENDSNRSAIGGISKKLSESWDLEVEKLRTKANSTAQGQLASSAKRVAAFIRFLGTAPMLEVRKAWLAWRSERDSLRVRMFNNLETQQAFRDLYSEELRVDVLLGGPPCQGFSRIGRGKIRSLRESGVHVQDDEEAGDQRNLLLLKYVLFVGALRPRVFLFENVRHFQAQVKTPDGVFSATHVLAEAIEAISGDGLKYRVSSRTIDATRHLIPQTRERFFMCGIRSDEMRFERKLDIPRWCLSLPRHDEVPLRTALEGLPEPLWVGQTTSGVDLSSKVQTKIEYRSVTSPENLFTNWIAQTAPDEFDDRPQRTTDSHYARLPRSDDQDLFQLMGPGRRWMDYRCDRSETLAELREILEAVRRTVPVKGDKGWKKPVSGIDPDRVDRILAKLDGSFSLRLLLECIDPRPGELQHHLISENYLAKREGNHGDWLARLSPNVPCKTIMSHMAKDTYAYVHPYQPRMLSVREAARIQSFPDWFTFRDLGFVDALRVIGNAVPPLLSHQFAQKICQVLWATDSENEADHFEAFDGAIGMIDTPVLA